MRFFFRREYYAYGIYKHSQIIRPTERLSMITNNKTAPHTEKLLPLIRTWPIFNDQSSRIIIKSKFTILILLWPTLACNSVYLASRMDPYSRVQDALSILSGCMCEEASSCMLRASTSRRHLSRYKANANAVAWPPVVLLFLIICTRYTM